MGEFPKFKNWRKQFKQAAANADADATNELQRITAIFELLTDRRIRREDCDYDGTLSWLENAESENERRAFHAILAQNNPRRHKKVLTNDNLNANQLWNVQKQVYCQRRAQDMANSVEAILSNCSEIHFIDRHFGPEMLRWRRPLEAFLQVISTNRIYRPSIGKIVVHTSDIRDFASFRQDCEDHLKKRVPKGTCLTLQRWKDKPDGEKMHDRYILSDIGGVKVDPGIDDSYRGGNFVAMLLERHLYEKYWNDFVEERGFDRAENPIHIYGA